MSHAPSSSVRVSGDVLFRVVGEEAVLLNLNTELYLGLDSVGTRMWNALTAAPTIQAAYDALLLEYDVEASRLREDLDEFLGKLVEQGLIQIGQSETTGAT
jgi:hypothetical protein